jgi:single-strand DNA-binding protein
MKLYVEGKLQTRTWEKDGQVRRKTEIIAENIQVLYRPSEYRSPNNQTEEAVVDSTTTLPENGNIPTLEIEDIF